MLKQLACAAVLLSGLAIATQGNNKLRLGVGTISTGAVAKWVVVKTAGNKADHQLYLAKNVPTPEFEAAGADIMGIAGTKASDLNMLCWVMEANNGNVQPRWNIYTGPAGGDWNNVTFLGSSQAGADGCFSDAEIEAALVANGVNLGDEVKYLQIILDEQGSVNLDDIKVTVGENTTVFGDTGNSGNGKLNKRF